MHCICLSQDQTIPVSTHNCCAAVEIRLSRKLRRDKWYVEMANFVWRRRQEAGKAEPFVCKVVSVGSCCNRRPRFSACDQWHQWPPISPPAQDSHFRVALSLQLSCLWPTAGVMLCPFLNLRPQGVPLRTSQGTLLHWDLAILLQRSMEQPVESQWGRADECPRVWVTWEVWVESTFTDSSTLETHPYVLINSQTRMSYSHSCAFHPSAMCTACTPSSRHSQHIHDSNLYLFSQPRTHTPHTHPFPRTHLHTPYFPTPSCSQMNSYTARSSMLPQSHRPVHTPCTLTPFCSLVHTRSQSFTHIATQFSVVWFQLFTHTPHISL